MSIKPQNKSLLFVKLIAGFLTISIVFMMIIGALILLISDRYPTTPSTQSVPVASTLKVINEGAKHRGIITSPPIEMVSGVKWYYVIQDDDDQSMGIFQCFSYETLSAGVIVEIYPIVLTDANQLKTEIWFAKGIPPDK